MYKITLTTEEIKSIQQLLQELAARYPSVDDEKFLKDATILAHRLPERLCLFLNDFRLLEPSPNVCLISGYPIEQTKVGKTPPHWRWKPEISTTQEEEMFLMLCGSLLGDLFSWATQQEGFMVQNVLPMKGVEQTQLGTASDASLVWHTEDAFHPYRGDYLGLMCLRNPYNTPTTYASIEMFQLEDCFKKELFKPQYVFHPDLAHLEHLRLHMNEVEKLPQEISTCFKQAYHQIVMMNENPQKLSVLFGNFQSPYMRNDPYYMDEVAETHEGIEALKRLNQLIDAHLTDLPLQPGDITFIDNYKVVHGRKSFKANFDGNDRWVKRINVTRNLRKSRNARQNPFSHVIY